MQQNKNNKLGRGISALLGDNINSEIIANNNSEDQSDKVISIEVNMIIAGIYQPRSFFDERQLSELSKSIEKHGVIQPIVVRRADGDSNVFEIIAGERRYRASKMAGLPSVPAIVKNVSNSKALEFAIIENVQREDLSAIEEARGYKQLIDEFGYTQDKVAAKLGKSRSYVANIVRLLSLPREVQSMVEEGKLSSSHARSLIGKRNAIELAREIVSKSLSVREVEDLDKNYDPRDSIILDKDGQQITKEKALNKEYLKALEGGFSQIIGDLKVKASYNSKKRKGKVTIFYDNFNEIENLIAKLENND